MRRKSITLIALISFIGVVLLCPSMYVLEIRAKKNHQKHFYSREAYENGFVISYTHSVNKGRVHDYYRKSGLKQLELYQTDFVSYGAGIPEADETPGAVFSVDNNTYTIKRLNRKLKVLPMAIGLIADHSIKLSYSEEIPLTNFFPAQTSIVLKIKKVSLINYLFTKRIK